MASPELVQTIAGYENYIEENGIDERVIEAYCMASKSAYEESREYGLEVSARCKEIIETLVKTQTGGSMWDLEKYCFEQKTRYRILDLYYSTLLLEAKNKVVDSGLRYLEKKRLPKERFYMPRREHFLKFGLIDALQGMIDDKYDILCVSLIPGAGKTTLEKFFLALVIGWYPNDFNLFYSHSGDITRMFYDGELDIVSNDEEYAWGDIFPDYGVASTNAKMEQFDINPIGRRKYKPFPSCQCTSVGASNAGKVRASKFLLVDDMIGGIQQALNPRVLDTLWNQYSSDARQRKVEDTDGRPCKEIVIATRWSVNDVIGRIMRMYEGNERVKVISIPDINPETGKSNFDFETGGFSVEFFADQALLMDEITYRCLYKQDPIEREGLLYHEEDLRRYLQLPDREPDAILGICDVKNKGTDYMFLPCCYQYGEDYYCVDCICDDNADFGIQENRCSGIILAHNMQQCEFEANNGGERFATNVMEKVKAGNGRCNITTKFTETNKETKIYVNADWVKKHVLFKDRSMIDDKSDYGRMMRFLLSYSVSGKNATDDVPDGWAMFALYVTAKSVMARVEAIPNPFGGYSNAYSYY